MTQSIVQIVPCSTGAQVNTSRFGFQRLRKDHVVVISTLAQALSPLNADESRFKAIKEGLNSLQLLENMAGSRHEFRGSVLLCGEDLENVFGRGLLNWGD